MLERWATVMCVPLLLVLAGWHLNQAFVRLCHCFFTCLRQFVVVTCTTTPSGLGHSLQVCKPVWQRNFGFESCNS